MTGVLRIEGSGIGLELDGSLEPFEPAQQGSYSPAWVNHSVVLGDTDIGVFTLLDVQGTSLGLPVGSGTTENYSVQAAVDTVIDANPPTFSQLIFSTDYLVHWIRPEGPRALPATDA